MRRGMRGMTRGRRSGVLINPPDVPTAKPCTLLSFDPTTVACTSCSVVAALSGCSYGTRVQSDLPKNITGVSFVTKESICIVFQHGRAHTGEQF